MSRILVVIFMSIAFLSALSGADIPTECLPAKPSAVGLRTTLTPEKIEWCHAQITEHYHQVEIDNEKLGLKQIEAERQQWFAEQKANPADYTLHDDSPQKSVGRSEKKISQQSASQNKKHGGTSKRRPASIPWGPPSLTPEEMAPGPIIDDPTLVVTEHRVKP